MARLTSIRWCLLVLAGVCAGARSGEAKEPAKPAEIAQARTAAKAGNHAKAGELLGKAVADAVKRKDLEAEQRAAEALNEILAGVEPDPRPDGRGDALAETWAGRKDARVLVAAMLKILDARRHGLFVSAHALALSIVFDAIALGDAVHVDEAAAALTAFATTPKTGAAGPAFAKFAEAVRSARAGDRAKAVPALTELAASFRAWSWLAPALHAYLELAAQHLAAGDPTKAGESLATARTLLSKEADKVVMHEWLHAVEVRAQGLPPEALDAFRTATRPFLGAGAGHAVGRGAHGGREGGGDVSPLGAALPKWPASKPFATATRGNDGFDLGMPFPGGGVTKQPLGPGERPWDASGVTLMLAGPTVALRLLDRTGISPQPNGRWRPSRAWSYWWLAVGETWNATKDGIEITGRAAQVTGG